ncbi:MAG: hypothetical protein WBC44_22255 [Planctomycetaceae bacterium]
MHVTEDQPLAFKFHWMDEKGRQTGFLRTKGRFDGKTLTLGDAEIPAGVILDVSVRDERMAVSVPMANGQITGMGLILPSKKTTEKLKTALDVARSSTFAERHREGLVKRGRGRSYRDAVCPNCTATVILSDMPKTPQLFCPFCHTLSFDDRPDLPVEKLRDYRLCDDCGMFSKPRRFTIFYFYFLLVLYGWCSTAGIRARRGGVPPACGRMRGRCSSGTCRSCWDCPSRRPSSHGLTAATSPAVRFRGWMPATGPRGPGGSRRRSKSTGPFSNGTVTPPG